MIVDDAIFNIFALSKSVEQYKLKIDSVWGEGMKEEFL